MAQALVAANPGQSLRPILDQSSLKSGFFTDDYTVLFDACTLYPAPLRDFIMEIAAMGLFRAKWTNKIHDEWIRNLLANRNDLSPAKLERTKRLMNEAIPDCLVADYENLIAGLDLPDEDDRHILAAAIPDRRLAPPA